MPLVRGSRVVLLVAICTGRVEAKVCRLDRPSGGIVAICTGRVEAKHEETVAKTLQAGLQSARGVWRQSCGGSGLLLYIIVAICTGRVEAKIDSLLMQCGEMVAICTGRVEAKSTVYQTIMGG